MKPSRCSNTCTNVFQHLLIWINPRPALQPLVGVLVAVIKRERRLSLRKFTMTSVTTDTDLLVEKLGLNVLPRTSDDNGDSSWASTKKQEIHDTWKSKLWSRARCSSSASRILESRRPLTVKFHSSFMSVHRPWVSNMNLSLSQFVFFQNLEEPWYHTHLNTPVD